MSHTVNVWDASDQVTIPAVASQPDAIVEFAAPTLSPRDMKSIVSGFQSESYEMVSTFVWAKAAATLKKQLATLGMEFVGEMLGRPDLDDDSDPATMIGDHEAIALAEDLGMITSTQGLRLKHSMELVTHFAKLGIDSAAGEFMEREEAVSLLKNCITSILGKPRFEAAVSFAEFRNALSERPFDPDDSGVESIKSSPYFFVRTTIGVLLSMIKSEKGATLEHAVGNTTVLIPVLWERLRAPERWQVGQAYAEVNAAGNRLATAGLKKALVKVHGFDFVPETLRSSTFTETAARVLRAHFGFNNYSNEEGPMSMLANLGTAIPKPAFPKCLEATLAVMLGNRWGHSRAAAGHAEKVLNSLRQEQWSYYLDECLHRDRTVLDKLACDLAPVQRWRRLIRDYGLASQVVQERTIHILLATSAGTEATDSAVMRIAEGIRSNVKN